VGHGHSNSFDRMIALEPFRRSASGRNKLLTYLLTPYLPLVDELGSSPSDEVLVKLA